MASLWVFMSNINAQRETLRTKHSSMTEEGRLSYSTGEETRTKDVLAGSVVIGDTQEQLKAAGSNCDLL